MLLNLVVIDNSLTLLEQSPRRQDSKINNNESRAKRKVVKQSIFLLNSFLNSKSHRLQLFSTIWVNILK